MGNRATGAREARDDPVSVLAHALQEAARSGDQRLIQCFCEVQGTYRERAERRTALLPQCLDVEGAREGRRACAGLDCHRGCARAAWTLTPPLSCGLPAPPTRGRGHPFDACPHMSRGATLWAVRRHSADPGVMRRSGRAWPQ
jgi:hypothetical protein